MNFGQAITSGFQSYVNFSGRAARSENWYWALFYFFVSIAARSIDNAVFSSLDMAPIHGLVSLALFLPSLAVSVRRLHDLDRAGWWILLVITGIGLFVLLIWFCMRGTVGSNRFGSDPFGL